MSLSAYSNTLTLREGLSEYLSRFGLGDGGYRDSKFTVPFFWIFYLPLPNIPIRIAAVKFHDLHHVLAEYPTGLLGEAEIGAWEIASGCGKYWPAWILNIGSFLYGIFRFPARTFHAFLRGRNSENLYHQIEYEEILSDHVGELRERLHIPSGISRTRWSDILNFACWSALSIAMLAVPLFAVAYLFIGVIR